MCVDLDQFSREFIKSSEFSDRAIEVLEKLQASEVHHPRSRDVKSLIEEIWPMAIFARCFELPQRRVLLKHTGRSPSLPDGIMQLRGALIGFSVDAEYEIETTVAEHTNEHLHRELLSTKGIAFQNPTTQRVGSRHKSNSYIRNKPCAVDSDEPLKEAVELAEHALLEKLKKGYTTPRILIISLNSGNSFSVSELCEIADSLYSDRIRKGFAGISLVCHHTGACVPVTPVWRKDRVGEFTIT